MLARIGEHLERSCAQPVSVKCVGGIDINELNKQLPNLIGNLTGKPSTVIIHCGTNDLEKGTQKEAEDSFKEVINNIMWHTGCNKVIISGLLHRLDDRSLNPRVDAINVFLKSLESDIVSFVNHNPTFKHLRNVLAGDGLHLRYSGLRQVADNIRLTLIGQQLVPATNNHSLQSPPSASRRHVSFSGHTTTQVGNQTSTTVRPPPPPSTPHPQQTVPKMSAGTHTSTTSHQVQPSSPPYLPYLPTMAQVPPLLAPSMPPTSMSSSIQQYTPPQPSALTTQAMSSSHTHIPPSLPTTVVSPLMPSMPMSTPMLPWVSVASVPPPGPGTPQTASSMSSQFTLIPQSMLLASTTSAPLSTPPQPMPTLLPTQQLVPPPSAVSSPACWPPDMPSMASYPAATETYQAVTTPSWIPEQISHPPSPVVTPPTMVNYNIGDYTWTPNNMYTAEPVNPDIYHPTWWPTTFTSSGFRPWGIV